MKSKINLIIYTLLAVLIPVLFFSCSSPIAPCEEGNGSIRLVVETSRNMSTTDSRQMEYEVILKSSDNEKYAVAKEGEPLLIEKLLTGKYTVYVRAEDENFIYEGQQDVEIETDKTTDVNIEIEAKQKGGQILLHFKSIYFDKTTTFNCEVLSNNKQLFIKNDIKATDIIDGKYIIPTYLTDGNYKVKVTGGHINDEQYIVNKNEDIIVKQGKVQEAEVKAVPYKTIYLSSVTSSSGTGGDGTKENPIHSLQGALELVKGNTEPIKIIVSGEIHVSTNTIELNPGQNITFVGQDRINGKDTIKASITDSFAKEVFRINGADVSFENIDVAVKDNTYPSITLNSGSLTLYDDVFIKEIKLNDNNKIKLRAPLVANKQYKISLDTFSENKEIFELSINSSFDSTNIILNDRTNKNNKDVSNFCVDNRGILKRKLYDASFKISDAQVKEVQYSEVYYQIKENDKEITPLTYVVLDYENQELNTFTVPLLKMGINYKIDIFSKRKRIDANENNSGLTFTYDNYNTYQYNSFTNVDTPITIDLSKGIRTTGSLKIVSDKAYEALLYPLKVTLISSTGETIKKSIDGFGYHINYLNPDTYTVIVETDDPAISYKVSNNTVVVGNEGSVNCIVSEEKKSVYYVKTVEASTNIGTKQNPFTSLSDAITKLSNKTQPITLVIESNVDVPSKISIDRPLNITLVGKEIPSSSAEIPNSLPRITANNGVFAISHKDAKITIKNLDFSYQRPSANESENFIELIEGELNILQNVTIDAEVTAQRSTPISTIKVGSLGKIYTSGFILRNSASYILLADNAKLSLLNALDLRESVLSLKAVNPLINQQVVESTNGNNNIIEKSLVNLSYADSKYSIDKYGKIILFGYITVNDLKDFKKDLALGTGEPAFLKIIVNNERELKSLGKKLRGFKQGQLLDLTLNLSSSIRTIDGSVFNFDDLGLQSIRSLTIESNALKTIGVGAFKNCFNLETITLPEGVQTIEDNAFDYCYKLTTLNLPSSLEVIGDEAFRSQVAEKDTVVNITDGTKLRYFGDSSFRNRNINPSSIGLNIEGLWKTTLASDNGTLESEIKGPLISLLNDASRQTKHVYIGKILPLADVVYSLERCSDTIAFLYVSLKQEDVISPLANAMKSFKGNAVDLYIASTNSTVTCIPANCFEGCTTLRSITLPKTINEINSNAFTGCNSLNELSIKSLDSSGQLSFDNTPWKITINQTEDVIINNTETPQGFATKIKGQYSGYKWNKALNAETLATLLTTPSNEPLKLFAYYEGSPNQYDITTYITHYGGPITLDLRSSTFRTIDTDCFKNATNLQSIILPDTLEIIGNTVFFGCNQIQTITIPNKVFSIGSNIFEGCTSLTEIEFKDTTSKWEFCKTSLETGNSFTVNQISSVPTENLNTFNTVNSMNKFITVSEALSIINAYNNDWSISDTLTFPLPVIVKSKQELNDLGNAVFTISRNFKVNLSLIMEGVDNNVIGSEFNSEFIINPEQIPVGCEKLFRVNIHSPNITLGSGSFMNSRNLSEINFDSTTNVEGGAFTGCTSLTKVSNHEVTTSGFILNGKEINSYKGVNPEVFEITIPSDKTVESIADFAFYGCRLSKVNFGTDIIKVGNYAFASCYDLINVTLSTNSAFNTLSTGLFYKTRLGDMDYETNTIPEFIIPNNVTTIMPGAIYTDFYQNFDLTQGGSPNIKFRSANTWHNADNSKTFATTSDADILRCLVQDTVIGENGIPTNDIYTNTASSSR